jgi:hypothetical protein
MLPGRWDMNRKGIRRWVGMGGAVTALLLSVGCGRLPESGGAQPDAPRLSFFKSELHSVPTSVYHDYQLSRDRGFNGTIADIGSSIDPRTPQKEGSPERTRLVDVTGRPAPSTPLSGAMGPGTGGSGNVGAAEGSSDMGWRARRGEESTSFTGFGSYKLPFSP